MMTAWLAKSAQVEDYVLWRVRDKPGQKALTGFSEQAISRSSKHTVSAPALASAWPSTQQHPLRAHAADLKKTETGSTLGPQCNAGHSFPEPADDKQGSLACGTSDVLNRPPSSLQDLVHAAKQITNQVNATNTQIGSASPSLKAAESLGTGRHESAEDPDETVPIKEPKEQQDDDEMCTVSGYLDGVAASCQPMQPEPDSDNQMSITGQIRECIPTNVLAMPASMQNSTGRHAGHAHDLQHAANATAGTGGSVSPPGQPRPEQHGLMQVLLPPLSLAADALLLAAGNGQGDGAGQGMQEADKRHISDRPRKSACRASSMESETHCAGTMVAIGVDTSLRAAQMIAAQARQRSEVLRGPPRSSKEDPAFQQTFFAASRLHFIGRWKARIEALAASLSNNAPRAVPPPRGAPRSIIHIDMDCFFAAVAGAALPRDCPPAMYPTRLMLQVHQSDSMPSATFSMDACSSG
jgi:hypothetical protein